MLFKQIVTRTTYHYPASDNLYLILGLTSEATSADIRNAYKKLARQYHPDLNSSKNSAEYFIKIKKAYETLIDPNKRRDYDCGKPSADEVSGELDYKDRVKNLLLIWLVSCCTFSTFSSMSMGLYADMMSMDLWAGIVDGSVNRAVYQPISVFNVNEYINRVSVSRTAMLLGLDHLIQMLEDLDYIEAARSSIKIP